MPRYNFSSKVAPLKPVLKKLQIQEEEDFCGVVSHLVFNGGVEGEAQLVSMGDDKSTNTG